MVHCFGAYFGIAVVIGMGVKAKDLPDAHRVTTYFSDMGAMIGTVVLWMFWPSFNGELITDHAVIMSLIILHSHVSYIAMRRT